MKTFGTKQDILNRLKEAYKINTDTELARFLGVSKSTLSNWISRDSMDYDKIFSKCEHININWLLRGEGACQETLSLLNKREIGSIPFYNLPVSAGALGVLSGWDQRDPSGYVKFEAFDGCECVLPVVGVSMEPIIYSGDWIGIKRINDVTIHWDFLQTDVIYLIVTHEDRMIKYIDEAATEDYIVCKSPNSKPFRVSKNDIIELYRVKAIVRAL